jgi:restriction endonuclease S subunit
MREGWVRKRLSEVTTKIGSGSTPRGGDESYKDEGISLIRSLNVYDDGFREAKLARIDEYQANALSNVVVEPHDVLLNITGASVARCCRAPSELLPARVNQHVSIVRPDKEALDPDFLHYLLISKDYKNRLLRTGEEGGSTRQAITKAQLQDFVIEFPELLPEQQRIVALLDEAFAGLATAKANAEQNLHNAGAIFESHLQSVFSQRGEGWAEATLGEVCEMYQPKTIGLKDLVSDGQYPVFGANGLIGYYDKYNHEDPQLLITCRGATCGSVNISDPFSWITGNAMVVRPLGESLDLGFLEYAFRGGINTSEAITGSAQPQITRTNLSPLPIGFPFLVQEQRRLAACFRSLTAETQHLTQLYERKLAALEELKKALLHQAFNGEL